MSDPSTETKPTTQDDAKAEAVLADKTPPPAWQAVDYNGPLTGEQAEWRAHHIKPVKRVRTK